MQGITSVCYTHTHDEFIFFPSLRCALGAEAIFPVHHSNPVFQKGQNPSVWAVSFLRKQKSSSFIQILTRNGNV